MDESRRVLFSVIYMMRGVSPGNLTAALGFDGKWVWKTILAFERQGLVVREGGVVRPAAWVLEESC